MLNATVTERPALPKLSAASGICMIDLPALTMNKAGTVRESAD